MAEKTGSLTLLDLMAARFQRVNAVAFGLDNLSAVANRDLAVHNSIMETMVSELAVRSTDAERLAGTSTRRRMSEVDEVARPPTKKTKPGQVVGFPLRRFQVATGWTRDYFLKATVEEFARTALEVQMAHRLEMITELKKALFLSANYSFTGELDNGITRAVKRFVNADSALIPDGPNGEQYDGSTHTHYLAEASLSNAGLLAGVNHVVEHGHGGGVRCYINQANEAAVRALTDFEPYVDVRLTPGTQANQALGVREDPTRLDNRPIGLFGAAEVWVKPWAIASYALIFDATDEVKPLVMREEEEQGLRGLQLIADIDAHPLTARFWEARFGFGVWGRTNGAVHYFAGGAYADPTIT